MKSKTKNAIVGFPLGWFAGGIFMFIVTLLIMVSGLIQDPNTLQTIMTASPVVTLLIGVVTAYVCYDSEPFFTPDENITYQTQQTTPPAGQIEAATTPAASTGAGTSPNQQPSAEAGSSINQQQTAASPAPANIGDLPDDKRYELQQIANRGVFSTAILSLFFPPGGYYLVERKKLALFALLTGFFGTLGIIIAPFHTRSIIKNARATLERHGYNW